VGFLDPYQVTALPAVIFLAFLPLWPFVQRQHSRLFLGTLSVVAIVVVAGPLLAAGLLGVIALAYFPIEWAAKLRSGRRVALLAGWIVLNGACWACLRLPLADGFRHLPSTEAHWVFIMVSGIGLTFLRLVSHMYDRLTGRTRALSYADYLSYMVYFPQFRCGPLERGRRFVRKLTKARECWSPRDVGLGLARIVLGVAALVSVPLLVKCLPDLLGDLDPAVGLNPFTQAAELSTLQIVAMIHTIALATYAVVSGMASIALGASRAFGVRGSENVHYPFLSASPPEVWRRWNITVFAWLRDYVYAPLGGKRHRFRNIVLVFLYCGLLHSFQLRGIVWGLWTGITLAAYVWLADQWRRRRKRRDSGGNNGPPRKSRAIVGVVARVTRTLLTLEWATLGAVMLVDHDHCGMTLLGEYFRRIVNGPWSVLQ
jgi:D-alanyl-lipoteichoic acid acyltransferase DltB (MBOAT superfamily)